MNDVRVGFADTRLGDVGGSKLCDAVCIGLCVCDGRGRVGIFARSGGGEGETLILLERAGIDRLLGLKRKAAGCGFVGVRERHLVYRSRGAVLAVLNIRHIGNELGVLLGNRNGSRIGARIVGPAARGRASLSHNVRERLAVHAVGQRASKLTAIGLLALGIGGDAHVSQHRRRSGVVARSLSAERKRCALRRLIALDYLLHVQIKGAG